METITLTIFDETLRDGEQQVGIFFDEQSKQTLAQLIAKTGVHHIALMPAIHHTEAELTKKLLRHGLNTTFTASTMMGQQYIDESICCGVKTIILFNAVSDRLLRLRDPEFRDRSLDLNLKSKDLIRIRQKALDKIVTHLQYAVDKGLKVCFAAEDASRADFDFLVECINKFQPYLEHFILCDTVGILSPEDTKLWIRNLIDFTGNQTSLAVHFHNDRGLAVENTIQAILAGATGVSGTFNGIGERSGNAALEQVLHGLRLRYGWQVKGINYQAIENVGNYLNSQGFRANTPYSSEALRYETGIHVESLLRDRDSYHLFKESEPEIYFGKFSGASNFKYLVEKQLGKSLPASKYQELRTKIKQISIREKRSFSAQETIKMFNL